MDFSELKSTLIEQKIIIFISIGSCDLGQTNASDNVADTARLIEFNQSARSRFGLQRLMEETWHLKRE